MIDANIEINEKVSNKICLEPKVIKSSTLISDYLLFATFAIISLTIKFLPWMSNMSKMNFKKRKIGQPVFCWTSRVSDPPYPPSRIVQVYSIK